MSKARFYIKDKVQEVGYRPFIIQMILDSDLEGTARNLSDGRVEVLLKGEKERILEFIERLKKEKPELAENPVLSDVEFNEAFIIPDAMRSSQSLLLDQFGKAVVYVYEINKGIKEIKNTLDKLPERIAEALKKT